MSFYNRTKTTDFGYKICLIIYLLGMPNFWIEELRLPKRFMKIYDGFKVCCNVLISILIIMELGAFFTQRNLSEKQNFNMIMYGISHPMLHMFSWSLAYNREKIRAAIYKLMVGLKLPHNDDEAEKKMMRTTVIYVGCLNGSSVVAIFLYTCDSCMDVFRNGKTFTLLITAWPGVNDTSQLADIGRAGFYIIWWLLAFRALGVYMLVTTLVISLSHQYINLQSYFYTLSDIFKRNDICQREKEKKYYEAFKVGIEFHSDTLRCTYACQSLCSGVFSGQIMYNILVMTVVFAQMMKAERNLMNLITLGMTASAVLLSTGLLMWNAGDITVEASKLYMAMYFSGWEYCYGKSSIRIRKLVVTAMSGAQRPVALKGFWILELSYESYLKIVKSSYSIFSVLY